MSVFCDTYELYINYFTRFLGRKRSTKFVIMGDKTSHVLCHGRVGICLLSIKLGLIIFLNCMYYDRLMIVPRFVRI